MKGLKKLEIHLFAREATRGVRSPLENGLATLLDRESREAVGRKVKAEAQEMIRAVRAAGEPNPWRDSSDDEIVDEIMRRVEELKAERSRA